MGPPFSESNNQLVWKETIRQLTQLMDIWSCAPDAKVPVIATQGLKDAALNVISYAGFGVQAEPITASSVSNTGSSGVGLSGTQFSQSLCTVTSDFRQTIMAIMLPPRLVKLIPGLNKVKVAYMEFREYLLQLLHTGQEALAAPEDEKKSHRSDNLLDRLLRSEKEAKASGQGRGLTESEILGNTFIMVIAGHETTAATFDYCVAYMCMNEDKQEWLLTELDRALEGQSDDPNEWPYELHKELTAIICVMVRLLASSN